MDAINDQTSDLDRRNEIVEAARALYEERGLAKTSVQDIMDRVGAARSLFYHYFPNKRAVTSAVLDNYTQDFLEALHYWNEDRSVGDIEHALSSVVKLMRRAIFEHNAFRIALASDENANLYLEFVNRVADRMTTYIIETTVEDYRALHEVRIEHLYETFYTLILGIIGFVRSHPDVSDEVIVDLIAQTLHMDRGSASRS